jgi:hypothetical protein
MGEGTSHMTQAAIELRANRCPHCGRRMAALNVDAAPRDPCILCQLEVAKQLPSLFHTLPIETYEGECAVLAAANKPHPPSPEEIAARTAEIRAGWSEAERQRRWLQSRRWGPVEEDWDGPNVVVYSEASSTTDRFDSSYQSNWHGCGGERW